MVESFIKDFIKKPESSKTLSLIYEDTGTNAVYIKSLFTETLISEVEELLSSKKYDLIKTLLHTFFMADFIAARYKRNVIYKLPRKVIFTATFYPDILHLYMNKKIQAYDILGKDRFNVTKEALHKIIDFEFFDSGYSVPLSGDSYSDCNVRAIFLYHSDKIDSDILKKVIDIVDCKDYKGNMRVEELKKYKNKIPKSIFEESPELELYFEII